MAHVDLSSYSPMQSSRNVLLVNAAQCMDSAALVRIIAGLSLAVSR
jgi:hypothetical protein